MGGTKKQAKLDMSRGVSASSLTDGGMILGRVGDEEVVLARSGNAGFAAHRASRNRNTPFSEQRGRCRRSFPDDLHVARAFRRGILGNLPLLARNDVGGVRVRPAVVRSRRLVRAVVDLRFFQQFRQRCDVRVAGYESEGGSYTEKAAKTHAPFLLS
jgi:hypothetical protein